MSRAGRIRRAGTSRWGPRDRTDAARTGAVLSLVAAVMTALFSVLTPTMSGALDRGLSYAIPVALMLMALCTYRFAERLPEEWWVLAVLAGIVGIVVLDIATNDSSAAGQVILCYPVLFAASQLRPLAAYLTAGVATVAEAVIVWSLASFGWAETDFAYVVVTLVAMTLLLVRAGRRQDELVGRLRGQAGVDPLTGLVTRRVIDEATERALSINGVATPTALILLDVDHFKTSNDTYGHPVGDDALVHVAAVLSAHTRPDAVIGRIGGDELAVLLAGCTDEVAVQRAEQCREAVAKVPFVLPDGSSLALSVSAGVACSPQHAGGTRELHQAADRALYAAKRAGRDRVRLASSDLPSLDP